jgi:transposase
MMQNSSDQNATLEQLRAELQQLRQAHRQIADRMARIDELLQQQSLSIPERREQAAKALRGTVTHCGDIVSPTGERWDAES